MSISRWSYFMCSTQCSCDIVLEVCRGRKRGQVEVSLVRRQIWFGIPLPLYTPFALEKQSYLISPLLALLYMQSSTTIIHAYFQAVVTVPVSLSGIKLSFNMFNMKVHIDWFYIIMVLCRVMGNNNGGSRSGCGSFMNVCKCLYKHVNKSTFHHTATFVFYLFNCGWW